MSSWLSTSAVALAIQTILQMVCGIVLHFRYTPSIEGAHASVEAIRNGDTLSQFLQNFHYWGSALLIVHAILHLAAMVWTGSYRPPNGLRFYIAIGFFACAFLFQLTGNLLPMDRHDVQTAVIEAGIGRGMPVGGDLAGDLILQGDKFSQQTLDAWYLVHRFVLSPLALLLVIGVFITQRRSGAARVVPVGVLAPIALLIVLALAVAAPSGEAAQPLDYDEYNAKVSWYTWPMHGALKAFQSISPSLGWIGAAVLPGLLLGFLVLLPLLRDRVPIAAARAVFGGLLAVFAVCAIGFGGPFAPLTGNQDPPATQLASESGEEIAPIDEALALRGKELFNQLDCASCHGKDGVGGDIGPAITNSYKKHADAEWYIKFIKDPVSVKPGSTMPAFPELKQDQLEALAEYMRAPK